MRNLITKFILGVAVTSFTGLGAQSFADDCCQDYCCPTWDCCNPCRGTVELKGGYFIFADKRMRKVYDNGGQVQLSGTLPLTNLCDGFRLDLYGSLGYQFSSGRSLGGHQKTSIWQIPVDLGLRPVFTICPELQLYATVGPRYFYIHQHNNSHYVYKDKGRSGIGLFVNTGINYFICQNWFLDIFGEYSYEKAHFHGRHSEYYTRDLQVGGYTIGAGLGYQF